MEVDEGKKIGEVVSETGIAKELIHHYLRKELLPSCTARGKYTEQQLRLLHQIKALREDHNVPLEVIRRVFALFDFDEARIESLSFSESLCKRMTRFATGELLAHRSLTTAGLLAETGITAEQLVEYVEARLVTPRIEAHEERYSIYDANVIALTSRGVALGIPLASFQTIASYVRVAFELEHAVFYQVPRVAGRDAERILTDFFVRREVATSFVENVLHSLTQARMREVLTQRPRARWTLDDVVYRPSTLFCAKHGVQREIERARAELGSAGDRAATTRRVAELLLHAGAYREAAFFLQERVERGLAGSDLRGALGRALVLMGEPERGTPLLEDVARGADSSAGSAALAATYLALARLERSSGEDGSQRQLREAASTLALIERALASAPLASQARRLEVTALAGWLLTRLPPLFESDRRGLELLRATFDQVQGPLPTPPEGLLPGQLERLRINAAYLLFGCLAERGEAARAEADDLRTLICCSDPGCDFARAVFGAAPGERDAGGRGA